MADTTAPAATTVVTTVTPSHLGLAVFVLVVALIGGLLWHAKIEADAIEKQQINVIKQTAATALKTDDQQIKTAQVSESQNQADLAKSLAIINASKQQPIQPVDYGRIDQMIAARTQVPVAAVVTQTDPTTHQATTTLPSEPLRDYQLSCDATGLSLSSCQRTQANQQAQITALTDEKTALQAEVKSDELQLKGGTFWHRFRRGTEHAACGAAAAGAGIGVSRQTTAGPSAISAGAVFGACEYLIDRK